MHLGKHGHGAVRLEQLPSSSPPQHIHAVSFPPPNESPAQAYLLLHDPLSVKGASSGAHSNLSDSHSLLPRLSVTGRSVGLQHPQPFHPRKEQSFEPYRQGSRQQWTRGGAVCTSQNRSRFLRVETRCGALADRDVDLGVLLRGCKSCKWLCGVPGAHPILLGRPGGRAHSIMHSFYGVARALL